MSVKPAKHGRDHTAGGEDPIPGLVVPGSMWPMTQALLNPIHHEDIGYGGSGWTAFHPSSSTTPPFGWYMETTTNGDANYVYAKLGPRGSMWVPIWSILKATDAGQVEIDMQLVGEVATLDEGGIFSTPEDPSGVIPAFESFTTPPTLYHPESGGGSRLWKDDAYSGLNSYVSVASDMVRLMGEDGAPITANALTGDGGIHEFDGGAGVYCIQIRCPGKNASSSGFRLRFGYFAMVRMEDQPLVAQ